MSISTVNAERPEVPTRSLERGREQFQDRSHERSLERSIEREPQPNSWKVVAAGSVVPLGLAVAAAVTTSLTNHERVAMTAWIAVAVVGSASVISSAVASSRRSVNVDRQDSGAKARGLNVGNRDDRGMPSGNIDR
ncbi:MULTISPECIES: hypothetical protein [unclassified Schlesneria]|uniref:hypothetical protein n=1 Tax=Schlesneria TaxID=656899 RepID=UPI002F1967B4